MIVGNDDWTLNIKEKLSKEYLFYSRENMQSNVTFDIIQEIRDVYV